MLDSTPERWGPRRTSCCAKVPGEHLRVRCGRMPGSGSHCLCLPPLLDPQQTRSRASTTSAGADGLGERCTTREHVLDLRHARRPRTVNGRGLPRRSFRASPRPGDARREPVPSAMGRSSTTAASVAAETTAAFTPEITRVDHLVAAQLTARYPLKETSRTIS